jgi:hypothetical protein
MAELLGSWVGILAIVLIIFMIVAPSLLLRRLIKKSGKIN